MSTDDSINIEISEKVRKTKQPTKIKRYDQVRKIDSKIANTIITSKRQFTYHPGMSRYDIKGDIDV